MYVGLQTDGRTDEKTHERTTRRFLQFCEGTYRLQLEEGKLARDKNSS